MEIAPQMFAQCERGNIVKKKVKAWYAIRLEILVYH